MRTSRTLLPMLMFVLAACAGQDQPRVMAQPLMSDVDAWSGEMPISDPWLRDQLPEGVLAYARMPHPLGVLAIPKGNVLDSALGSEANISNLVAIQQGLAQMLTESLGPEAGPTIQLLFDKLASPIEVTGAALPAQWVMIGMTLDIDSNAEFEALLRQVSQTEGLPPLSGPLDDAGYGQFLLDQPIFVNFDAATGRLALFGGLNVDRSVFESMLDVPPPETEHPMRAFEAEIDSSGQGYFAWVDTSMALGLAPLFLPPDMQQMLRATSVDQIRALALGAGVANGKGRLKLIADIGTDRTRRMWPVIENRVNATSVGDPRALFLLSIPGPEEFSRLESLILSFSPDAEGGWDQAKLAMVDKIGVSIEELLGAVGPDLISFSDAAGDFMSAKIRDPALLASVLDRLAASAGVPIDERNIEGQTIRYVALPGNLGMPDVGELGEAAAVFNVFGRMKNRMYWIEDGEYLYMTAMPQPLIDRIRMGSGSSIADWLADTQRVDLSSSLLGATGSVANMPRWNYELYVSTMQSLADLVGVDYDVWAMPTARDLGLPERGTLGASINLGEPHLSLELTYENHPAEALFGGGGVAGIAAVGVAAAIALPAYQDYTIRAQVSEGLALAAEPKAAVVEYYSVNGRAPADLDEAGFAPDRLPISGVAVRSIDIVDGQIIITYGGAAHAQLAGQTVVLTPYTVGGPVSWVCGNASPPPGSEPIGGTGAGSTSLQAKHLPSACRPGAGGRIPVPAGSGVPIAAAF